jgi:hypothetical protein
MKLDTNPKKEQKEDLPARGGPLFVLVRKGLLCYDILVKVY